MVSVRHTSLLVWYGLRRFSAWPYTIWFLRFAAAVVFDVAGADVFWCSCSSTTRYPPAVRWRHAMLVFAVAGGMAFILSILFVSVCWRRRVGRR